jgi:hypothetical protein
MPKNYLKIVARSIVNMTISTRSIFVIIVFIRHAEGEIKTELV